MKKYNPILSILMSISLILFLTTVGLAQVAVNTTGSVADNSAMLDVVSTTKGMLIPRMTKDNRDAISNPATGLMIYQTDNTPGYYYYNSSAWGLVGDGGATDINGLTDGRTGGNSVFLGTSAGANDDGSDNNNVGVGFNSLKYNTSGFENTAVGHYALYANTTGVKNVSIGMGANGYNQEGSFNTMIGHVAGGGPLYSNRSRNIFIGYTAGYNETGSNRLYIEPTTSSSPLIYGEFDNDLVRINGDLDVTGTLSGMAINDLSDGKSDTQRSIFLGVDAGAYDGTGYDNIGIGYIALTNNTTGSSNIAIGDQSLSTNTTGRRNTAVGHSSLDFNTTGSQNTALGYLGLYKNTSGSVNTAIGHNTLWTNTIGHDNTAIGVGALYFNISGNYNIGIGISSLYYNTIGNNNVGIGKNANANNREGSNNTIIGHEAGYGAYNDPSKSGNIFLGYQAGYSETSDNKLYIENSNSTTPLIYGNFTSDFITIHGNLGVGTKLFGNGTNTLCIENGTAPNASIIDGILLYSEDAPTTSELKVRDEAGNITTLSPHNFSLTAKSESMAWSYYSENSSTGQIINVDMLKVVRLLETVTGEKLVHIQSLKNDTEYTPMEVDSKGIVQQQQSEIDELKNQNKELLRRLEKLELLLSHTNAK